MIRLKFKFILMIIPLLPLFNPAVSVGSSCNCTNYDQLMEDAAREISDVAKTIFEDNVQGGEKYLGAFSPCMTGIWEGGFDFNFIDLGGLPSMDDLIGAACDQLNSQVRDHLGKLSAEFGIGKLNDIQGTIERKIDLKLPLGTNSTSTSVESRELADFILQNIQ